MLTDAQLKTPLAKRPYDLRHARLTLWLNGGVPAADVAARAGHSVAMLPSGAPDGSAPGQGKSGMVDEVSPGDDGCRLHSTG
nr:hypothetical protein GCM10010200_052290 [Actinomadura rugatobispora]